jgi:hypothetical protein
MTTIDFRSTVHKRITALRGTTLYTDHYTELTVVVRWSPPVVADSSPPGTPPLRHTLTYRAHTIQLIRITKKLRLKIVKKILVIKILSRELHMRYLVKKAWYTSLVAGLSRTTFCEIFAFMVFHFSIAPLYRLILFRIFLQVAVSTRRLRRTSKLTPLFAKAIVLSRHCL